MTTLTPGMIFALVIIGVWELIWKGIALWKCGRNNQLAWFVFILILNTVGILPIIYIAFFQKKPKPLKEKVMAAVKKRAKKR